MNDLRDWGAKALIFFSVQRCWKIWEGYSDLKMVQISINTLVTSRCSVVCGSENWLRNFGPVREPHMVLGAGISCLCAFGRRITSFAGPCDISQPRSLRVQAGWLFKGNDKGSELDASCEHSESANEDILMFFFELDLATRVQVWDATTLLTSVGWLKKQVCWLITVIMMQYALNLEQYEVAQQLRNKLTEVWIIKLFF